MVSGGVRKDILKGKGNIKQAAAPLELDDQELEWNTAIHELPAESYVNMPEGVTGSYQWTDLYGEVFQENNYVK